MKASILFLIATLGVAIAQKSTCRTKNTFTVKGKFLTFDKYHLVGGEFDMPGDDAGGPYNGTLDDCAFSTLVAGGQYFIW